MATLKMADKDTKSQESKERDFRLFILLIHVCDAMMRGRAIELGLDGITNEQAAVYYTVMALGEKATPRRIASWLLRRPNSVTGLLKRMESQGLLVRSKGPNGKGQVVTLTDKGMEAYYITERAISIHETLDTLSQSEKAQLRSLLKKLRVDAFRKIGVDHRSFFK